MKNTLMISTLAALALMPASLAFAAADLDGTINTITAQVTRINVYKSGTTTINVGTTVCVTNTGSEPWATIPYNSTTDPDVIERWVKLATAALLSGRDVNIDVEKQGNDCLLTRLQLR